MQTVTLTVYVRRHCHLCEEMLRALEPYCLSHGAGLLQVDVDEDPVLTARYSDAVPVLVVDGVEICRYRLDLSALQEALGQTRDTCGEEPSARESAYARIYAIVRQIPPGRVATYGQIAKIEGHVTARMVGYAMSALDGNRDVPWQRVLNSQGRLSDRKGGGGFDHQRRRLEAEGIFFDTRGCVDFERVGWPGPDPDWLQHHRCFLAPAPASKRRRILGERS